MTSPNNFFGAFKSRAKLVQETAKSRIEKFTEQLDKKLKEAQEDLEKQRSKAETTGTSSKPKIWRPSVENPDGVIITLPKPPPITIPIPTANVTIPESPQATTAFVEPPTIKHTKRRAGKRNGYSAVTFISLETENDSGSEQKHIIKERNNYKEITLCLNDLVNEIVERENVNKCLNELIDIILTVDELVENVSLIPITPNEDVVLVQDSVSHSEDNTDEESTAFEPERDLGNMQMDVPEDEVTSLTNIEESPVAQSDPEIIQTDIPEDEIIPVMEVPDLSNDLIKSKNIINTPPNELEDSFNELMLLKYRVPRPSEKSPEKLPDLAALHALISKIEDDEDDDVEIKISNQNSSHSEIEDSVDIYDEPSPPEQHIDTSDKEENIPSEQLDTSHTVEDILPRPTSNPVETQKYISIESLPQTDSSNNEPSIDELTEGTPSTSYKEKPIEKKRCSTVNCHPIQSSTKIHHMNCSSTYIYICTDDRKIFYAKITSDSINHPLTWQQHSESADQLVVSASNRTIWRLLNKHLYSSLDSIKFPPIGSQWNKIKIANKQSLLSMSINDQCGWYIQSDGSLWLIRTDNSTDESINVTCPFNLNAVVCFSEKVGVTTRDGEILIRVGCTNDRLEGDGWIFIEHNFGIIDDFVLLTNNNIICIVDKKHQLWIHQWSCSKGFFQVLCNDDIFMSQNRHLVSANSEFLCFTDCQEQIQTFSDCIIGIQWIVIEKNTRLQRLIGAFSDENYVWALTTDRMICASNGQTLDKPRQAQYLIHATFVPDNISQDTILWSLDESCNIYVRANVETNTQWEQLDQSQFAWNRRLVHIVCNTAGVWAVDDRGCIHFRHGHICTSHNFGLDESSLLAAAWIPIPGQPKRHRSFSHVFCGPADWMVYATDNKQTVYTRVGVNEEDRIGTSWKAIEDCSVLELSISEHNLWILTSCGEIQCRENVSLLNPIGTRSTTLPGRFLSLTVSIDDSQVWALDSSRNLLKLDRLTALFEK